SGTSAASWWRRGRWPPGSTRTSARRSRSRPAAGSRRSRQLARPASADTALRAQAEQLDRVADVGEAGLAGDLCCPVLDRLALDLHAASAMAAGQVMVVRVAP